MMFAAAATFGSSPLWYLTRSTGIVAFLLMTVALAFGVAATQRALASRRWPRFATQTLHRNVSLLGMVLIVVHVLTTILDSYVQVGWGALLLPGASSYKTLPVALGTIAFDLLLLVSVTSMLRLRMSARAWRVVHWASYLAWPLALMHFLLTGTDAANGRFGLWLGLGATAMVLTAVGVRLASPNERGPIKSVVRNGTTAKRRVR